MFNNNRQSQALVLGLALAVTAAVPVAHADQYEDAARKWAKEFSTSTLDEQQRLEKLEAMSMKV